MLLERIEKDFITAMKAHEAERVSILRTLRAALQNAAIAARTSAAKAIDDAAVEAVIRQEVKRLRDALTDFTKAAREDLAGAAKREIEVLSTYLPQAIDSAEVQRRVKAVVATLRTEGVSDVGSVMKAVMADLKGAADGTEVSTAVRNALEQKKDSPK
ncbi:aspartyl-tRNA amidotransferase [Candidatus Uhrbacteria bacterium CG10_big_fil_rev_8_21_14_0_10_48_11]|uniref:Aspartyl-tRNA amidotransferase n=1 Tax=Candidatus Uhrbacteria bacterium CG10_big_fil_rev_8_21_14_0_10_48_11 TaxID=1975037 RepID=A0A2M8LF49_9BACT|nr:MAG: aspartyl-tRNA amidotransferase [Candidatus Uhrbacteria bacterium CG10_big_fil_rev_8_21_14_0_10_48_11]